MKQKKQGFTLIELMVVIAIIGILSAITLAFLSNARAKSRDTRRAADLRQIKNALELYYANVNNYPTSLASLAPTYIARVPNDPRGGAYAYAALGTLTNCSSYHIGAVFEDPTSPGLSSDVDAAVAAICTGSAADFSGLSAGSGSPLTCNATAGTAAPAGTERCYDVRP